MRPIGSLFLKADADRDRLPVVLLSGFLGSGKTTLVNALLRDPAMARTAVAVNEFGAVPVDSDLIDHGADKTVVMSNGCLCCNLAGDMEDAVMRLFSRRSDGAVPAFERLIIEPSGLSDPAPIAQGILRNPMLARAMRLEAIVTTVDAMFGARQLRQHAETAKQVALADRLVLTKTDMVGPDVVSALVTDLRALNQIAPIELAAFGAVDPQVLFPARFLRPDAVTEADAAPSGQSGYFADEVVSPVADHLRSVTSIVLTADAPLDWRAFERWLSSVRLGWSEDLLRVKGLIDVDGGRGPVVVQGVHHVMHAPVELADWPGGTSRRGTRLVLIANIVIEDNIRDSWRTALPNMMAKVAT
jgi:G3E family GTPase